MIAYGQSYDMREDAIAAAKQAQEKLTAPSVKPGKYDLVLDPSHLWLTIHESVGHPTELDRVLGYEANYAGTSFATLDKWKIEDFKYGSDKVTLFADKTQPGSLGAVGYDDEGVKTKRWDLIKDGILVNYQAIRDQAHILGQKRIARLLLRRLLVERAVPAHAERLAGAGQGASSSVADMIEGVENGIYIVGDGSFSIDQQRYNVQFGGQLFYEIKNGKITEHDRGRRLPDPHAGVLERLRRPSATRATTASAARSSTARASRARSSPVSHGSSTARFNGVNVINTARSLG